MHFCSSKTFIKRVEKQATEWQNMFAIHISDKDSYLEYMKIILQINWKQKQTNKLKKMGETFNQVLFKNGDLNNRNMYEKLFHFISHQRNAKQRSTILFYIHPKAWNQQQTIAILWWEIMKSWTRWYTEGWTLWIGLEDAQGREVVGCGDTLGMTSKWDGGVTVPGHMPNL